MTAQITGIITYLAFTAVWYLPLVLLHRKVKKEPVKFYIFTLLLGMVSAAPALAVQSGLSRLLAGNLTSLTSDGTLKFISGILFFLVGIGLSEELSKFFLGRIAVIRTPDLSESGSMLIMGMAGIGFGLVETLNCSGVADGVIRGILNMHLFLQLWMGRYIWRAWNAKKQNDRSGYRKNVVLALCLPVIVHSCFDYFLMAGVNYLGSGKEILGMLLVLLAIAEGLAVIITVMTSSRRLLKKEKAAADSGVTVRAK